MSHSSYIGEEENRVRHVARKSTNAPQSSSTTTTTTKSTYMTRRLNAGNPPGNSAKERLNKNFNPKISTRERRRLNREFNSTIQNNSNQRRPLSALYDENGVHLATGMDLCDCLNEECCGCFFPCPKCGSEKCGIDCRVHRKFIYDQIEYQGYDIVIKNPISKHYQ